MRRWRRRFPRRIPVAVLGWSLLLGACGDRADRPEPGLAAESTGPLNVRFDSRVELMSILFHMAGRDEYTMTQVTRWEAAVDSHFGHYAEHPAVAMTERLAGPYDVGYFVPMNLAVHLTAPPELAKRGPLAASPSIHRTWTTYPDTTDRYLELVRSFARATRYDDFLASQRALIDTTEARLRRLVDETVDAAWLDRFWGTEPGASFALVPGLVNGRASYGVEYQDTAVHELYAITGVMATDDAGFPVFGADFTATVVHEINHPYVDPLVEAHLDGLGPPADTLFGRHAETLRRQAIGSGETLLHESLVRAAVARYRGAHEGGAAMEAEVAEQVELGFEWLPGLVALLGEDEAARDRWPDLGTFMPRVVAFFEEQVG